MDFWYVMKGLFSFLLYLGAHFGVAFLLFHWGRKHFGAR